MMPKIRQALVEFERLEDAINCVRSTQENQIYILDRPVFFNFSTSQEITRYKATYSILVHPLILSMTFRSPYGYSPSTQTPPQEEPPMNNILLYTIFNPIYPITVVSLVVIRSILLLNLVLMLANTCWSKICFRNVFLYFCRMLFTLLVVLVDWCRGWPFFVKMVSRPSLSLTPLYLPRGQSNIWTVLIFMPVAAL